MVILREALNERTSQPMADEMLGRMLQGKNPSTGQDTWDRDQMDPVRMSSLGTALLKEKIPPHKATQRLGLSNLLVWHLTGQGNGTSRFLDTQKSMYFESAAECIAAFEPYHQKNLALFEEQIKLHPRTKAKKVIEAARKLPQYMPTHNTMIYGEASNWLGLTPTRPDKTKLTIEEKINPLFVTSLQESWFGFMGALAGCDPSKYQGKKPTWMEGFKFLQDLGFAA